MSDHVVEVGTCSGCGRSLGLLENDETGARSAYHPWTCFDPERGGRREPCPDDVDGTGMHPPASSFVPDPVAQAEFERQMAEASR